MRCKKKTIKIQKEILGIKKIYPRDGLILSYKDFLNNRELLPFYQFNPHIYESLIDLALIKWKSRERINRISLLETLKRYSNKGNEGSNSLMINNQIIILDYEIRKKLFLLYKTIWTHPELLSDKQIEQAQRMANFLLINIPLKKPEEIWLCENYETAESILNRLLRYPQKSSSITKWATENYNNDKLRPRRAELVSFILDENPDFQVDDKTVWQDFLYQNKIDLLNVEEFKQNVSLFHLLNDSDDNDLFSKEGEDVIQYPNFEVRKRFYHVPTSFSKEYYKNFPNFNKLEKHFKENLGFFKQITMLWAIGYSRLSTDLKSKLLKENYSYEVEGTFIRICKKYSLLNPLEWLLLHQK